MHFLDWEFNQHTPEKVQTVSSARGPIIQKVKAVSRHFNRVTGNLVETSRRELLITSEPQGESLWCPHRYLFFCLMVSDHVADSQCPY